MKNALIITAAFIWAMLPSVVLIGGPQNFHTIIAKKKAEAGGGGVDNTLLIHYKMNEGSGTALTDSGTLGVDATITSATWDATGNQDGSGPSLVFDGTDDSVVSDAVTPYATDVITVCVWVYNPTWPGGAGEQAIFCSGLNASSYSNAHTFQYTAGFGATVLAMTGDQFYGTRPASTLNPADAAWTHIALVYNNEPGGVGSLKLYWGGVLEAITGADTRTDSTGAKGANFTSALLTIGNIGSGGMFWNGEMHDFRIYDGELTLTEIEYVRDNPQ